MFRSLQSLFLFKGNMCARWTATKMVLLLAFQTVLFRTMLETETCFPLSKRKNDLSTRRC